MRVFDVLIDPRSKSTLGVKVTGWAKGLEVTAGGQSIVSHASLVLLRRAGARMADLARRFGVEAEVAKFEDWDPAGRAFDAVIAGQAWRWVDPVAGAAKAAQVLRPGGRLAVFWNSFRPPAGVDKGFAEVWHRVFGSPFSLATLAGPDAYSAMCTKAADGMRQAGAFGDPQEWRFDWDRPYTREEWLEVVPTFGGFSQHPPAKQQELLAGTGGAIDAVGGQLHDGLHRGSGHRGAIRRRMTQVRDLVILGCR
jgi:SAM-dependent methyltransferase